MLWRMSCLWEPIVSTSNEYHGASGNVDGYQDSCEGYQACQMNIMSMSADIVIPVGSSLIKAI